MTGFSSPLQVFDQSQKDYEVERHALFFNDTGSRELYQVLLPAP